MNHQTIAVILGGGAGSRLFPLTRDRSKPAVPLAGKYRLIDIPVSNCINSGIERIFVLTQYNSASLNRHIALTYRFDRFKAGFVTILAAEQTPHSPDWYQGTADAVRQSFQHINDYWHDYVLILSGDQLYQMDYCRMLEHHQRMGAEVTIGTIPVMASECPGFGILKTDEEGWIKTFCEKPPLDQLEGLESEVSDEMRQQGRVYLASMGIYVFNKEVLGDELGQSASYKDFGKEVIPAAIQHRRVVSYPFTGYWSDIGTIQSFYEANLMMASKHPPFDLYSPTMPIYTNPRMLPPAKIQSSYVQDSMIAEASIIINSHISNSVIGIRAFIANDTTIKNSIIMGSDYFPWHEPGVKNRKGGPLKPGVGEGSYVENAIVDKNVSIGRHCVIKNREGIEEGEGPGFYIRDRIVIIPKNAEIPDGTII